MRWGFLSPGLHSGHRDTTQAPEFLASSYPTGVVGRPRGKATHTTGPTSLSSAPPPSLPPSLLAHASRYITPRFQAIFTASGNLHRSCWIPYRMEPAVSSTTNAANCLEGHTRLLLLLYTAASLAT